jgi:hypothetical protein
MFLLSLAALVHLLNLAPIVLILLLRLAWPPCRWLIPDIFYNLQAGGKKKQMQLVQAPFSPMMRTAVLQMNTSFSEQNFFKCMT